MRMRWLAGALCLLAPLNMIRAEGELDFIQSLLDKGYIELASQYRQEHLPENANNFSQKLLDLRFLKAEAESSGSSQAHEKLEELYKKLASEITPQKLDADRLNLKFEWGQLLLDKGNYQEALKQMSFFANYCPQVLQTLPDGALKQQLNFKFYDSDLHIGEVLLKLMNSEEDKEKKIDLADQALEKLEDYIWSLGKNNAHIAIQGYLPLLKITHFLDQEDFADFESLVDQFTNKKLVDDGENWIPLWFIEANPSSIVDIFDVSKEIVRLQKNDSKKLSMATDLLKRLEKIKLDPEPTYYMKDHHHFMMANFCSFLIKDSGLGKKAEKFRKKGISFVKKISLDPTKSPYAKSAAKISSDLGLRVEAETGGSINFFNEILKLYANGQFEKGRQAFERFLPWFGLHSPQRAHIWFRIGQGYFQEGRLLEASLAFQKSWETHQTWSEDEQTNAQVALRYMNSSAINYSKKYKKMYPNPNIDIYRANRDFMQSIRKKIFTEIPTHSDGVGALFFWALNMYSSKDIDDNIQKSYEAFNKIPKTSKYYGESLYYKFQCSFKTYQSAQKAEEKKTLFEKSSRDSKELFQLTENLDPKKKEHQNLLKLDATARTTVIQLYLLEENYAAQAKELLEPLEKKYGAWLEESIKKLIPTWKIEARYGIGDIPNLKEAMSIWKSWQQSVLSKSNKPSDLLIKTTQDLANKGIKLWMSKNDKSHPDFKKIQQYNTEISTWITQNVKITPLLLIQLAAIENRNAQWNNVVGYCESFIEAYEKEASWKKDPDAQKYLANIYRWQVEAYENMKTVKGYLSAKKCWEKYYERTPHSSYLKNQADSLKNAGDLSSDQATAMEYYGGATRLYSNLRKKSKLYAPGTEKYWETYDLTLHCREKMGAYETCAKILTSLRFDVADSDKRRTWLLQWLDRIESHLDEKGKSQIILLRENIEKDRLTNG